MLEEDQKRFGALPVTLRDQRQAVIRPLRRDDAAALAAFYARVPREDFRFYCPHRLDEEHARSNAADADSPLQVVLVLEVDSRIGGYAWYRWARPESSVSMFGICVDRDYQNAGAGRLLIQRLLDIARHVGPPVMELTVQEANPRGVALYRKMGFEIIARQMRAENYMGWPAEPEYKMCRAVR